MEGNTSLLWFTSVWDEAGDERTFSGKKMVISPQAVLERFSTVARLSPAALLALLKGSTKLMQSDDSWDLKAEKVCTLLGKLAEHWSQKGTEETARCTKLVEDAVRNKVTLEALPGCVCVLASGPCQMLRALKDPEWSLRMSVLALTCANVLQGLSLSLPARAIFAPLRVLEAQQSDLSWDKNDEKIASAWTVVGVTDTLGGRVARTVLSGLKELFESCELTDDERPPLAVLYQSSNPVRFNDRDGKTPEHWSFVAHQTAWLKAIDKTSAFEVIPSQNLQRWAQGRDNGTGVFLLMCSGKIKSLAAGALESALARHKIVFNHLPAEEEKYTINLDQGVIELLKEVKRMPTGMEIYDQLEELFRKRDLRELLELSEGDFCALFPGQEAAASLVFIGVFSDDPFELFGWEPPKRPTEQADSQRRLWLDAVLVPSEKKADEFPRRWTWERLLRLQRDDLVESISMRACLLEERDCVFLRSFLEKYQNLSELNLSGNCLTPSTDVLKLFHFLCNTRKIRIKAEDNFWDDCDSRLSDVDMTELRRLIAPA